MCRNCGEEVSEGSNFCANCGARLVSEQKPTIQDEVRNVLIARIQGIKEKDAKAVEALVHKERYSKFDDWPPFDLQGPEALKKEAEALKVLEEYDYETRSWKIEALGDSATAAFIIRYRGRIRDVSFNIQSRVTAFLTKREGEWKVVHEHWSRFPEQESSSERAR